MPILQFIALARFSDAVDLVIDARVYAGIHFRKAD